MTESRQPSTGQRRPTHIAYHVRDGRGEESFWNRVGVAWANADGKGFNIQLDVVPLDGRVTLRVASEAAKP